MPPFKVTDDEIGAEDQREIWSQIKSRKTLEYSVYFKFLVKVNPKGDN